MIFQKQIVEPFQSKSSKYVCAHTHIYMYKYLFEIQI